MTPTKYEIPFETRFEKVSYMEVKSLLHEVYAKHWQEVPMRCGPEKLDLDDRHYETMDIHGLGARFVLRRDDTDEIIAYISFTVILHPHHKNDQFAVADAFFVKPKYRGQGFFRQLIYLSEKSLKARGVNYVQLSHNTNFNIQKVLKRLGYTKSDILYMKKV